MISASDRTDPAHSKESTKPSRQISLEFFYKFHSVSLELSAFQIEYPKEKRRKKKTKLEETKKTQSLNSHRMFTLIWSGGNPDPTQGKRIRGELLRVASGQLVCVCFQVPFILRISLMDGYKHVRV